MSHFTKMNTRMTELEYLVRALRDTVPSQNHVWEEPSSDGGPTERQVTVSISGSGELLRFQKVEGTFEASGEEDSLLCLRHDGFFDRLFQRYAYHATIDSLAEQGFSVVDERVATSGELQLLLRRAL